MNEISKYNYIKIEELTLNEDIKYITFNTNSKEIKPYKNKPNITNNEVIFIIKNALPKRESGSIRCVVMGCI